MNLFRRKGLKGKACSSQLLFDYRVKVKKKDIIISSFKRMQTIFCLRVSIVNEADWHSVEAWGKNPG